MLRLRMVLVTSHTMPLPRIVFYDFPVAAFRKARWVRGRRVVLFDVDDGCFCREVVSVFSHAKVFILNLQDRLPRIATATSSVHGATHVGM